MPDRSTAVARLLARFPRAGRGITTLAVAALVGITGPVTATAANAASAASPIPEGIYLSSPWVKPGGTAHLNLIGLDCESVSASFVEPDGTSTELSHAGFGGGYWTVKGVGFRDRDEKPLDIGFDGPVSGDLEVTCTPVGTSTPVTVTMPLLVSPTQPDTIYNSALAWTWFTPGSVTVGAEVRISALGFQPGESATVTLLNGTKAATGGTLADWAAAPVLATADGEGAVTALVTVPDGWAAGDLLNAVVAGASSHYVLLSDEGEPINGIPSMNLETPGAAVPGGSLAVSAGGFVANETVTIGLHSATARAVSLGTLKADSSGAIAGAVTLPANTTPGSYQVWSGAKVISYLLLNTPLAVASTSRIAAPDRFSNAVAISQAAYPATAPIVYVATGLNYPDALGAGAAAAAAGGPLLLTTPTALPAGVKSEIQRLAPAKIVVVGGPNSVSDGVFSALRALAPSVIRQGGADRYEASRTIVAGRFTSSTNVFIATGANFPDALSATSAAASKGAPVVLVPGANATVDVATLALLDSLGVTEVTITGGPNSVSPAIEAQLKSKYGSAHVVRLGGADRFEASTAINTHFFDSASEVFLATGSTFPDALAGGVLAADRSAPLLVVRGDCVPAAALDAIRSWGVTKVTLLGGQASLSAAVETLQQCS